MTADTAQSPHGHSYAIAMLERLALDYDAKLPLQAQQLRDAAADLRRIDRDGLSERGA